MNCEMKIYDGWADDDHGWRLNRAIQEPSIWRWVCLAAVWQWISWTDRICHAKCCYTKSWKVWSSAGRGVMCGTKVQSGILRARQRKVAGRVGSIKKNWNAEHRLECPLAERNVSDRADKWHKIWEIDMCCESAVHQVKEIKMMRTKGWIRYIKLKDLHPNIKTMKWQQKMTVGYITELCLDDRQLLYKENDNSKLKKQCEVKTRIVVWLGFRGPCILNTIWNHRKF